MNEIRKMEEFALAGTFYGGFDYDRKHLDWLLLHRVTLPAGLWNKKSTRLLLMIPGAYPEMPPPTLYLDDDLRDRYGRTPAHFYKNIKQTSAEGYAWFCIHLERNWRPSKRIEDGDNLLKVVQRIQLGLGGQG